MVERKLVSGFAGCLVWVVAAILGACSATESKVTQVLVSLEAEAAVAQRLTSVVAETYDFREPYSLEAPHAVSRERFDVDAQSASSLRFPFSFGVRKNEADRFLLVVTGFAGEQLIIEQKLQVEFVEHEALLTRVVLAEACLERGCSSPGKPDWFTNTCHSDQGGACSAVEVAATTPVSSDDAAIAAPAGNSADAATGAPSPGTSDAGSTRDAALLDAATQDASALDAAGPVVPMDAGAPPTSPDASSASDAQVAVTMDAGDASSGSTPDAAAPESKCYKVRNSAAFSVQAGAEVQPSFILDAPWGDASVQGIKLTPIIDNAAILKRWLLYDAEGALLASWGPGLAPIVLPNDVGLYLPSGKMSLKLVVHYQNVSSSPAADASGVELCVTERPRTHTAGYAVVGPIIFSIPPQVTNREVKSSCTHGGADPVTLLSGFPNMRLLGTRSKLSLNDGVASVDAPFAYAEHEIYPLNFVVRSGDKLDFSCFYTNPGNTTVAFGSNMSDELCFNLLLAYPRGGLKCGAPP